MKPTIRPFILPKHLSSPPIFSGFRVTPSLVFCVIFRRSLFVFLSFFMWSLCCLSVDLRLLITHSGSSNFLKDRGELVCTGKVSICCLTNCMTNYPDERIFMMFKNLNLSTTEICKSDFRSQSNDKGWLLPCKHWLQPRANLISME